MRVYGRTILLTSCNHCKIVKIPCFKSYIQKEGKCSLQLIMARVMNLCDRG